MRRHSRQPPPDCSDGDARGRLPGTLFCKARPPHPRRTDALAPAPGHTHLEVPSCSRCARARPRHVPAAQRGLRAQKRGANRKKARESAPRVSGAAMPPAQGVGGSSRRLVDRLMRAPAGHGAARRQTPPRDQPVVKLLSKLPQKKPVRVTHTFWLRSRRAARARPRPRPALLQPPPQSSKARRMRSSWRSSRAGHVRSKCGAVWHFWFEEKGERERTTVCPAPASLPAPANLVNALRRSAMHVSFCQDYLRVHGLALLDRRSSARPMSHRIRNPTTSRPTSQCFLDRVDPRRVSLTPQPRLSQQPPPPFNPPPRALQTSWPTSRSPSLRARRVREAACGAPPPPSALGDL